MRVLRVASVQTTGVTLQQLAEVNIFNHKVVSYLTRYYVCIIEWSLIYRRFVSNIDHRLYLGLGM